MKSGRERAEPLQFMLTGEELELVDDFRFQKRMPTRASAVRELLKRGLAAEGFRDCARDATDPVDKASWLQMAASWDLLAHSYGLGDRLTDFLRGSKRREQK